MNKPQNYLIDYEIFDVDNISLKQGQIKVKNKFSEFEAKCSLEDYLKKRYYNFHRLVISKCLESYNTPLGEMSGWNNIWDLFK